MKKRLRISSKTLQELSKKGGRKGMRQDFLELLKRAAKTTTKTS